ncbi:MAG: hypothetical protein MZV63_63255 [Marinilabiliales bacterium]|nr:hypothetical protein [Marinilabiliales bacterium]
MRRGKILARKRRPSEPGLGRERVVRSIARAGRRDRRREPSSRPWAWARPARTALRPTS